MDGTRLDVVTAAKLHDAAHRVPRAELGTRLVHQLAHVFASSAHRERASRATQDAEFRSGPTREIVLNLLVQVSAGSARQEAWRESPSRALGRSARRRRVGAHGRRPPWVRDPFRRHVSPEPSLAPRAIHQDVLARARMPPSRATRHASPLTRARIRPRDAEVEGEQMYVP